MEFVFTEEQDELRKTLRQACAAETDKSGPRVFVEREESYDPAFWDLIGAKMGLAGLAVPEEFGGAGGDWVDMMVLFEELGRAVMPVPALSTMVLATTALLASDDDAARREYLPRIAAGELTATVAFTGLELEPTSREATVTASGTGAEVRLSGRQDFVVDGATAQLIIAAARSDAGLSLYLVAGDAAGLSRTPLETIDLTRAQARLEFADTPATLLGSAGSGLTVLDAVRDHAAIAIAAENVGGAQAAHESAVAYAKDRVQFDRVIGSFQAVKHKLVDLLQLLESARSATHEAALSVATSVNNLEVAAPMAKALSSDAYLQVAKESLHLHGGIGFTWEHDAHLFLRRAKANEVLLGPPHVYRELMVRRLGI